MSKAAYYEPTEIDMESRPSRLGLGAKVSQQTKVGPSNDPVERKPHAKLDAEKRRVARSAKECIPSGSDNFDDDDDDTNLDSRTNAFTKRKTPLPLTSTIPRNKKQKQHICIVVSSYWYTICHFYCDCFKQMQYIEKLS